MRTTKDLDMSIEIKRRSCAKEDAQRRAMGIRFLCKLVPGKFCCRYVDGVLQLYEIQDVMGSKLYVKQAV